MFILIIFIQRKKNVSTAIEINSHNIYFFRNEDVCETLYSLAYKGKKRPNKLNLEGNKIDIICDSIRDEVKTNNRYFANFATHFSCCIIFLISNTKYFLYELNCI